jgi:hypothetical protein
MQWLAETFDMRFYYWTDLNWIILFPVYVIGLALIALLWWWLAKRMKRPWAVTVPLLLVLALGPWVEEFWIAWNFGRLCKKDAGIFIYRTVEVEGFYNATGATLDLVRPGGYRFVESHARDGKGVTHVTYGDDQLVREAFARYEEDHPGKRATEQDMLRVRLDDRTEALVYPKKGDSWRITRLDHPTARYHYRWPHSHTPVSHKLVKHERVVVDTLTNDVLGRDLEYGRKAPWFYLGLDRPLMLCPSHHPLAKYGSIFKQTLKPIAGN